MIRRSITKEISALFGFQDVTILERAGKKAFILNWARPEYWIMLSLLLPTALSLRASSPQFVLFFLFFSYFIVAAVFNRTVIEVTEDTLFVKHGPLPWLGNRSIPIHRIKSVYAEHMQHSRRTIHNIRLVSGDEKGLTVVYNLYDEETAFSLVKLIERWLSPAT